MARRPLGPAASGVFRGKQYMPLLKRVSAVRTGKHTPHIVKFVGEATDAPRMRESLPPPPPVERGPVKSTENRAKTKSKGFYRINKELSRIAAIKRPLTDNELLRLDELVKETKAMKAEDNSKMFQLLHQRARLVRKSKTPMPKHPARRAAVPRGVLPAGLIGSRRLTQGGREVLGGLPSSRRGH